MQRKSSELKGTIFDMDGVLADTQSMQSEAERLLLEKYGIFESSQDLSSRYAGIPDIAMFLDLLHRHHKATPSAEQLVKEKWVLLESQSSYNSIEPIPYSLSLIKKFKQEGFRLAVASGAPSFFIKKVLNDLNIMGHFEIVISSDEVQSGKPAPDLFLEAAQRMGIHPSSCVVIEDGTAGMRAAKAAGMLCIGLVSEKTIDCCADIQVHSLNDLNVRTIAARLARYSGKENLT